jgi:hypothetical protein
MNDRLGGQIQLVGVSLNLMITTSNSDTYDSFRVTIVQAISNNPNAALSQDLQDNVFDPLATASYPWLAPFNMVKKRTYQVIYDELIHVNENGLAEISRRFYWPARRFAIPNISFVDDGGAVPPALEGGLVTMFMVSNSTSAPNPAIEYVWRTDYFDT